MSFCDVDRAVESLVRHLRVRTMSDPLWMCDDVLMLARRLMVDAVDE